MTQRVSVFVFLYFYIFIFLYFYISSSHLWNLNMLFPGIPQPFQIDSTFFMEKRIFFLRETVRDCTCTTRVVVKLMHCTTTHVLKKNLIFFCPFPSLFHPLCTHSLPEVKTIFFKVGSVCEELVCVRSFQIPFPRST